LRVIQSFKTLPFKLLFSILCLFWVQQLTAQEKALVFGVISDLDNGAFVDFVTVYQKGTNNATETDIDGNFRLEIEADQSTTLVFSRLGYIETETVIKATAPGKKRHIELHFEVFVFG